MSVQGRLEAYFQDYASYHRTEGNKVCHSIGIPLIQISVLGFLALVCLGPSNLGGSPLLRIDLGSIVWALSVLFYVRLDWKVGLAFSGVSLATYFVGRVLPWPVLLAFFVLGWILQGIGHGRYEKKSPAFFKNVTHLLIGPIWIFHKMLQMRAP